MKQTVKLIVIGFFSGALGSFCYNQLIPEKVVGGEMAFTRHNPIAKEVSEPNRIQRMEPEKNYLKTTAPENNFVDATVKSASSVVYIKTISRNQYGRSWFDWFFGDRASQTISSGSGVIYTKDGYIITNNHVINNADRIEVVFNKRNYPARIVGTDPSTDIAVLKIEAQDLPNIAIGNSKNLMVGEWVIAVGNPFNLTSTVTAGIVSAKGREINILKSEFPIESFIQTDAAINPGNSGGALVNNKGELVGINTAILSRTGSYAGYGFAVPVDIVVKVTDDMINYGEVQKAFLGADVLELNPEIAERLDVSDLSGVVISKVTPDWAADKAGLKKGDIILEINGEAVNSRSAYEEMISYQSPGDRIRIRYKRKGKISEKQITLTNRLGSTHLIKRDIYASTDLGADLENISDEEKKLLGIDHGVRILRLNEGLIQRLGIKEGFIITHINKNPVNEAKQLENNLLNIKGRVIIEGMNSRGVKGYYNFYF